MFKDREGTNGFNTVVTRSSSLRCKLQRATAAISQRSQREAGQLSH